MDLKLNMDMGSECSSFNEKFFAANEIKSTPTVRDLYGDLENGVCT